MLIIEGPDGSGKTGLLGNLEWTLGLPAHKRAVTSDGVPVTKGMPNEARGSLLSTWAYNDVTTMPEQPMAIYDRHPLISEYIYGPIVRGSIDPNMLAPSMHLLIRMMAKNSLVIFCRPPNDQLVKNVGRSSSFQMNGVSENILKVAAAYDAMKMFWPGDCITHDYTNPESYLNVLTACRLHLAQKEIS